MSPDSVKPDNLPSLPTIENLARNGNPGAAARALSHLGVAEYYRGLPGDHSARVADGAERDAVTALARVAGSFEQAKTLRDQIKAELADSKKNDVEPEPTE